ncbi:rhomboid domain-containing protein 2 [Protopterus annectens]|uniref:rhomboid domain-containing protein 2 n=1 Tax=Protopterus annectens TaxID=7888 RepID=UPI001CFB22D3|nr:rhomboid domain-containing protein 2 [Protopterus annectens]
MTFLKRCGQWLPEVQVTTCTALTVLIGVVLSLLGQSQLLERTHFSLDPVAVLFSGEVHRLGTYIFFHEEPSGLLWSILLFWFFSGSLEKALGTVRLMFLTAVFVLLIALVYLLLEMLLFGLEGAESIQGFVPLAFAMVGMSTTRSRMKRTILFGINVPLVIVPWLLLIVALILPDSSLFGNGSGILVGKVYGIGFCSFLEFSEFTASAVDKWSFFRFLKRLPGLVYVPGSVAERRAAHTRKINPIPGSYPTQAYYSPAATAFNQETYPVTSRHGSWQAPGQSYPSVYEPVSHYSPVHSHGYDPHHGYQPHHGYRPRTEANMNSSSAPLSSHGHCGVSVDGSSSMTGEYSANNLKYSAASCTQSQASVLHGGYRLNSQQEKLFIDGSARFSVPSSASQAYGSLTADQ